MTRVPSSKFAFKLKELEMTLMTWSESSAIVASDITECKNKLYEIQRKLAHSPMDDDMAKQEFILQKYYLKY